MRTSTNEKASSRILVVEDQSDIQILVRRILEGDGHEVTGISDGERAVRMIETQEFDLVILDVMMPKLDGYEVLRQMGAMGIMGTTAILMLTALGSDRDWIKALRLGAHDYLPKPFDGDDLLSLTNKLLLMTREERSLNREACLDRSRLLVQLEIAFGPT